MRVEPIPRKFGTAIVIAVGGEARILAYPVGIAYDLLPVPEMQHWRYFVLEIEKRTPTLR